MARLKSDDRRSAILSATVELVAQQGTAATTASIAKHARVAEGSIFTYFENKDDLLNQIYLDLKRDLINTILSGFPERGDLKARARHVWQGYVAWGVSNPSKRKAMAQLSVSERISAGNKARGQAMFAEVTIILSECVTRPAVRDLPASYPGSVFAAIADATMDAVIADPSRSADYSLAGFEALWNALHE